MIENDALALPAEAAAEAASFLRAGGAGEEALIAALARSAAELCERFTGTVLIARGFTEILRPSGGWQRLGRMPVRSISSVEALPLESEPVPLPAAAYVLDIDGNGEGWLRIGDPAGALRVRASYQAGMASAWSELPDALRHGVIRLAAHLYNLRETAGHPRSLVEPPAAVTALWRPYRRLRLA
jgi:uncharacterized phiE125 gp8 family phage protein